jgi:tetratricopeptide (TPR) repeat protein
MVDLMNPHEFDLWWGNSLNKGLSPKELIESISDPDIYLVSLRKAQIILGNDFDLSKQYTIEGFLSGDRVVQLFCMQRLAWLESQIQYHRDDDFTKNATGLVSVYESVARELEQITSRSKFLLEALANTYRNLSEAFLLNGEYSKALEILTKALLIVDGLKMKNALTEFRSFELSLYYHLGLLEDTASKASILMNDLNLEIAWRIRASCLYGMALSDIGDDTAAINFFRDKMDKYPNELGIEALYYNSLGKAGCLSDQISIQKYENCLFFETQIFLQCDQILCKNFGQPTKKDLELIFTLVSKAKSDSGYSIAIKNFYRAISSLRLREINKAAEYALEIKEFKGNFYAIKCLILLLKLEISLFEKNRLTVTINESFKNFVSYFQQVPDKSRKDIVKRAKIFFPYAATFVAFAPNGSSEFHEICGNSVFRIESRISIFNKHIQPVVAACLLLEDFGITFKKKLNEVQLTQEKEVFLQEVSGKFRKHWYKGISPGFLVFQYLKAYEESQNLAQTEESLRWWTCALSMADSHGLVPHSRGFEIETRQKIERILEEILKKTLLPSQFHTALHAD